MGILEFVLIGLGLAMDAFAVSVCKGLSMKTLSWKKGIIIALYFGIFQMLMPVIGYFLGTAFEGFVTSVDHWIAFILLVLIAVFIGLRAREKSMNRERREDDISKNKKKNDKSADNINVSNSYSKQSIMNFMEFDKIEDNMIVQRKGRRYLMVVECQGVNYDLMSNVEKVAVEEGFQQFLNTLRHPIQIYIKTRMNDL